MTAEAVALLIQLQGATNVHDAHGFAVAAVKAGATSDEVSDAISDWMNLQRRQVQQVFSRPHFGHCYCGRPVLSSSLDGTHCSEHDAPIGDTA